jgi:hypothetical protein
MGDDKPYANKTRRYFCYFSTAARMLHFCFNLNALTCPGLMANCNIRDNSIASQSAEGTCLSVVLHASVHDSTSQYNAKSYLVAHPCPTNKKWHHHSAESIPGA